MVLIFKICDESLSLIDGMEAENVVGDEKNVIKQSGNHEPSQSIGRKSFQKSFDI